MARRRMANLIRHRGEKMFSSLERRHSFQIYNKYIRITKI